MRSYYRYYYYLYFEGTTACPNCHPPTGCRLDLHEPHIRVKFSPASSFTQSMFGLFLFFFKVCEGQTFGRLRLKLTMKWCTPSSWVMLVCIALCLWNVDLCKSNFVWLLYTATILSIKKMQTRTCVLILFIAKQLQMLEKWMFEVKLKFQLNK